MGAALGGSVVNQRGAEPSPTGPTTTGLPSDRVTVQPPAALPEGERAMRDYRDAPRIQTGARVPRELHELAEAVYWPHRRASRAGVGAVYAALLERLRTDAGLRAWVEAWIEGE